jgi:SSS family solute:Na+ symporter
MDAYDFIFNFGSPLSASFWQAIIAFLACAVVLVVVSLFTKPKPAEELRGLVWGLKREPDPDVEDDPADKVWWRSPELLGGVAIALLVVLNLLFI